MARKTEPVPPDRGRIANPVPMNRLSSRGRGSEGEAASLGLEASQEAGGRGTMRLMTRHCWKCGTEWTLSAPPGRLDCCLTCGSDLKVCRNCVCYDPRAADQCRDRRAEPVGDKHLGNFCEWFEFARRDFTPAPAADPREAAARAQLKKLLGD
jgi:hypothetical protein